MIKQSSQYVYVLSFLEQIPKKGGTGEFVGVYSSLVEAEGAKKRVLSRPSYGDPPHSFRLDAVMLNVDYDGSNFFDGPPPSGPPPDNVGS